MPTRPPTQPMHTLQLYALMNSLPDIIVFKDATGRIVEVNDYTCSVLGLDVSEIKGRAIGEVKSDALPKDIELGGADAAAFAQGQSVRTEITLGISGTSPRVFEVLKAPILNPDGSPFGMVIIGRDITARAESELELQATKEELESIISTSADAISVVDLDGLVLRVNAACEGMFGWQQAELLGCLLPLDSQMDIAAWLATIKRGGRVVAAETVRRRKDGRKIHISVTASPIHDSRGNIVAMSCISRDITERIETLEMLKRSETLSVVGQMAAGIAHEIRNPLASLRGFTQLLQGGDEKRELYCQIMLQEIDRINSILNEVLKLAKPQEHLFEIAELEHILEDVISLLDPQANFQNIRVVRHYPEEPIYINCVRNQLVQVFINILKNAIEASQRGREIEIVIEMERLGWREPSRGEERPRDLHLQGAQRVVVRCRDYGCGIPADKLAHLGEPFHTTKKNGTGLGLMITEKILQEHQGELKIASEVGVGTTVDVVLSIC